MPDNAVREPGPPRPRGWVRKSVIDARLDRYLPIPTQVVSNEEFHPVPQTPRQKAVERRLLDLAERASAKMGMDRRAFLRTSCGMAAAFAALNHVFGPIYAVAAEELTDPAAGAARADRTFILDAQTHHVPNGPETVPANQEFLQYLLRVRSFGGNWNPALAEREIAPEELERLTYIKEIFLDSETDVAVLSGLPQMTADSYVISPEEIARTTSWVNHLTESRRAISHGVLSPELGARNLESMHAQVEAVGIEAWKGYPGQPLGSNGQGWWLDDEKTSYPALELSRKLGIRNVCLHKGLPGPMFSAEHCHPKDLFRPALDFPDLNFLVYHAGFQGIREAMPAMQDEFTKSSYIPWVSDLCDWKRARPEVANVYMELGATFGMTAISFPLLCAHMLGMMIAAFGEDHVLWGTDSIWWGSPQWQIEAMKRLEMPESLMKRFGYAPLTKDVKRKIFGLNAARVYGIDLAAGRHPMPDDYVARLKELYKGSNLGGPSHTQYGWVAR